MKTKINLFKIPMYPFAVVFWAMVVVGMAVLGVLLKEIIPKPNSSQIG